MFDSISKFFANNGDTIIKGMALIGAYEGAKWAYKEVRSSEFEVDYEGHKANAVVNLSLKEYQDMIDTRIEKEKEKEGKTLPAKKEEKSA